MCLESRNSESPLTAQADFPKFSEGVFRLQEEVRGRGNSVQQSTLNPHSKFSGLIYTGAAQHVLGISIKLFVRLLMNYEVVLTMPRHQRLRAFRKGCWGVWSLELIRKGSSPLPSYRCAARFESLASSSRKASVFKTMFEAWGVSATYGHLCVR